MDNVTKNSNKVNNKLNNKANNKVNNKARNTNKNNNNKTSNNNNNKNFIVNKSNNGTYMTGESLIYVIGFLVILIIIYNFFFVSSDDDADKEKEASQCPDYWDVTDEKMCRNVHRIGKCGLENDVDFNDPMFTDKKTGDLMKCKWSKYCNVPWEHIDDNC